MNRINRLLGTALGRYLTTPLPDAHVGLPTPPSKLRAALQPGDVLLVEGNLRISQMIKYLSQSTWSHAAIYVGEGLGNNAAGEPLLFIEADLLEGVRACPLREYRQYPTRICRPHRLDATDRHKLITYLKAQLGRQYDLKHVLDLARYLLPLPVPARFRRQMITLGSGDPTKAICSTLIAEAFQHIRYPILPSRASPSTTQNPLLRLRQRILVDADSRRHLAGAEQPTLTARAYAHTVPRDFDVSPYFEIIKPTLQAGFDYRDLEWAHSPYLPPSSAN